MVIRAVTTGITGAIVWIVLYPLAGVTSSLRRSLTTSAIGWRSPSGPTRLGPSRFWINAETRRSAYTANAAELSSINRAIPKTIYDVVVTGSIQCVNLKSLTVSVQAMV